MGRIFTRREQDVEWEVTRPHTVNGLPTFGVRRKIMGDDTLGPFARIAEYGPGYEEPRHAHDADEVLYVLEGELQIGPERYGPGALLYIERDTVYGPLKAGPNGFKFLLVRQAAAEYLAQKRD